MTLKAARTGAEHNRDPRKLCEPHLFHFPELVISNRCLDLLPKKARDLFCNAPAYVIQRRCIGHVAFFEKLVNTVERTIRRTFDLIHVWLKIKAPQRAQKIHMPLSYEVVELWKSATSGAGHLLSFLSCHEPGCKPDRHTSNHARDDAN